MGPRHVPGGSIHPLATRPSRRPRVQLAKRRRDAQAHDSRHRPPEQALGETDLEEILVDRKRMNVPPCSTYALASAARRRASVRSSVALSGAYFVLIARAYFTWRFSSATICALERAILQGTFTRMSNAPGPLSQPPPWNLVSKDYALEVLPIFTPYSKDALALVGPTAGARVLDVACGPGTLTLEAAKIAKHVHALDFSPGMIAALDARVSGDGIKNVTTAVGDGHALPYQAGSFDVTASMFGLFMFADRAKGLAEMKRVLVPGGRAVIAAWRPFREAPLMEALMNALAEQLPDLPFGKAHAPMGEPQEITSELTAAGFRDVRVEQVTHAFPMTDMSSFWSSMERTLAPLAMLRAKMGEAWPPVGARIVTSLTKRFGEGAQPCPMPALLGVGVA